MRRATFTNRTLLALLAALVVGSVLGESAEQTKVRITTWNLEWFPNGSAREATPEKQTQRIQAAADVLKKVNPDILLLQEVRDYDACNRLAEAIQQARRPRWTLDIPSGQQTVRRERDSAAAIVRAYTKNLTNKKLFRNFISPLP